MEAVSFQALQEKISDRAQQLMELLDRRSGGIYKTVLDYHTVR